jgi:hypothetical protein
MTNEIDDGTQGEAGDAMGGRELADPAWPLVSLEEQLAKYAQWNDRYALGITSDELEAINPNPTVDLKPGEVDLVACYLPEQGDINGIQRTFDTFARIMADEQGALFDDGQDHAWRWNQLLSDADHLQMLDGYEHRPGLRRVILHRTDFYDPVKGRTLEEVRTWSGQRALTLAASEVLMDAAIDPRSAQAMDGATIPYRDMAGYRFNLPDDVDRWSSCPYLHCAADIRRIGIYAYFFDSSCRVMSAPSVRSHDGDC